MRTSLNQIKLIEDQLLRRIAPADRLLLEAHLVLDPDWKNKVQQQQQVYRLVREYGRRQLKAEIEAVHRKLFTAPEHYGFRQRVLRLFFKT